MQLSNQSYLRGGCIKGIWKGCVPHTEQLFPRVSDSNRLRLCRIQIRVSNNTGTVEIGQADRKAFLGFLSSKLQVVFANRETNGLGTKSGTSCCLIIQCSLLYTFAWIPFPFLEESKENLCWPILTEKKLYEPICQCNICAGSAILRWKKNSIVSKFHRIPVWIVLKSFALQCLQRF